jgi:hypothetical protein
MSRFFLCCIQGRIQDFKLEGAHLEKLRRAEGGAKIVGVFRVKNHDFTPKNHIFSNFRGGARRVRPPWIRPWYVYIFIAIINYKEGTGCDPIKLFNLETGLCPYFDFERTR